MPDACPAYQPRLADVNWAHGSLVVSPTPPEPVSLGSDSLDRSTSSRRRGHHQRRRPEDHAIRWASPTRRVSLRIGRAAGLAKVLSPPVLDILEAPRRPAPTGRPTSAPPTSSSSGGWIGEKDEGPLPLGGPTARVETWAPTTGIPRDGTGDRSRHRLSRPAAGARRVLRWRRTRARVRLRGDDAGYFGTSLDRIESPTVAVTTEKVDFAAESSELSRVIDSLDADVRLRATNANRPMPCSSASLPKRTSIAISQASPTTRSERYRGTVPSTGLEAEATRSLRRPLRTSGSLGPAVGGHRTSCGVCEAAVGSRW